NACDSVDSNTFPILALAEVNPYRTQVDWTRPLQYVLSRFALSVTSGGITFSGFDLAPPQGASQGIAWDSTAQVVVAMNVVSAISGGSQFAGSTSLYLNQLSQAQGSAPFGDGMGLIGATLSNGDVLPPYGQCLSTPFACIAERVELAA